MSSPPLLVSFSQISSQRRCDNCKIILDQVRWKQCKICTLFDLCHTCAKPDVKLELHARLSHNNYHMDKGLPDPKYGGDMDWVLIGQAETSERQILEEIRKKKFEKILDKGKIENDHEMSIIMGVLEKKEPQKNTSLSDSEIAERSKLGSMLVEYHIQGYQREIRVLSLDGGGIRGYMPIKVLSQLIKDNYLPDIDPNHKQYHEKFEQSQFKFTDQFDYFVGTSTGGFIAMCLAAKYPILKIQEIYKNPSGFFTKNRLNGSRLFGWLGDIMSAKYNDKNIHDKIDQVIDDIFEGKLYDGKPLTAQNATLLDLHNLLNPHHMVNDNAFELSHQYHGNLLEFVDNKPFTTDCEDAHQGDNPQFVKREKVLLITAYNTTTSNMTVFNTSFAEHWNYRIADVLKATMAAPTYFPPWSMFKGRKENGNFVQDDEEQVFIDGGVFANDPELIALWTIRIQWKKVSNYRLLSIGTGCYNPQLPTSSWGGYYTWLFQTHSQGLVIDTLMDATRSLTETITKNLAKLDDTKRMKFNYKLTQPLNLDDSDFPTKFDQEWETLKQGPDYKALCYFYTTYIEKKTMKTDP